MLIREGHTDVLKYRANFFRTCIDELLDYCQVDTEKENIPIDDKNNIEWLKQIGGA